MDHQARKEVANTAPVGQHNKQPKGGDGYSVSHIVVLLFLTFNSATAIYRSIDEPRTVAFVVLCYVDLLLLFWCLRMFEKASPEKKERLKVAVWTLSTILTVMFSYRVSAIMPLAVKAIVWGMAGLSISAGFYAFFLYRGDDSVVAGGGSTTTTTTKGLP